MLTRDSIARVARRHGMGLGQAEHDYVVVCVLDALSKLPSLRNRLVFKGGTALRQVYFPDWRYSEDLDFTAWPEMDTEELRAGISEWFDLVREEWGVFVRVRRLHRANGAARLRAQFMGPLAFPGVLLMDFTLDEPLILPPVSRPVVGSPFDDPRPIVQVYALEELLAEKLRSILQRGKSRDYYDVWRLLKEKSRAFDRGLALDVLRRKCRHKGLSFSGPDDFLVPRRISEAGVYWERDLQEQAPHLPEFREAVEELSRLLSEFLGR